MSVTGHSLFEGNKKEFLFWYYVLFSNSGETLTFLSAI